MHPLGKEKLPCPTTCKAALSLNGAFPNRHRQLTPRLVRTVQAAAPRMNARSGDIKTWYLKMVQTQPVMTKALTAFAMSSIGNSMGQLVSNNKASFDVNFMLRYATVCAPPYSHFWYLFLDKLRISLLAKVFLDQVFWRSLMTWWGYVSFGLVNGDSPDQIKQALKENFWPTLKNGMLVWPAVQLLNQRFVPALYQTLTLDLVNFFWDIYMTLQMGRTVTDDTDPNGSACDTVVANDRGEQCDQ